MGVRVSVGHGSLRAALDASVQANEQLTDVDAVLVEQARVMADHLDKVTREAEGVELTKALYLMPHLNNLMREMFATPAARAQSNVKGGGESAKKAKLTALRGGKVAG